MPNSWGPDVPEMRQSTDGEAGNGSVITSDRTAADLIAAMLTENTGSHFMDSGGADGRVWQRHARAMGDGGPVAYLSSEPFVRLEDDLLIVSTFHHLCDVLTVTPRSAELDAEFHAFAAESDGAWLGDAEDWVTSYGDVFRDVNVVNTYNSGEPGSQDFQYVQFYYADRWYYVLHTHNGADIRGGYSTPHVFAAADESACGWEVGDVGDGVELWCPNDACRDDDGCHHAWQHIREGCLFEAMGDGGELDLCDSEAKCPHCGSVLEVEMSRDR